MIPLLKLTITSIPTKNRESIAGTVATTFTYDHTGQRVKKVNGTDTTLYPFTHYEVENGEATKHVYLSDMLVATVEADTPAPKLFYKHLDHLGSTNAVTGDDGYLNQLLNYRPFGNTNIDNQYDTVNQTKRYTGHQYDQETELNYMRSRYQDGKTARFLSQDPASLKNPAQFISDPQLFNTYGYARNNPIKYNDPTGEVPILAPVAYAIGQVGAGYSGISYWSSVWCC